MDSEQKIIERIRKLMQLADTSKNTNLEEAASAAAKAQKLMEKYRIAEAMLDVSSEIKCSPLNDSGNPETWKIYLTNTISKNNNCYIVCKENNSINLIGEVEDIEAVQSLFKYLARELSLLCIKNMYLYKVANNHYPDKTYIEGFYLGAIQTIDEKLKWAKREVRTSELKAAESVEEHKIISNALSKIDRRKEKAEEWANKNLDIKMDSVVSQVSREGYQAGSEAADTLNVSPDKPAFE